ncbi:MAG: type II toxin-antitoxin system RelE/ParE family toxin [Hyphomicrobiales bacterium]|nr:type II toxin-antitoxin system RelE/ParE family toxin [Hyphomicrobiales bacterium]
MILNWTIGAQYDLRNIEAYIADDNPTAAKQVVLAIIDYTEKQLTMPHIGRPGRVAGTRELVMPKLPYTIAYRITDDRIDILRVMHQSRLWPDMI